MSGGDAESELEDVSLKLALANDEQFGRAAPSAVPYLLRKLQQTSDVALRKKIVSVLADVRSRLKGLAEVSLPFAPLLALLRASASVDAPHSLPFVSMFALLAFERATQEEKMAHVPAMLLDFAALPVSVRVVLFSFVANTLLLAPPENAAAWADGALRAFATSKSSVLFLAMARDFFLWSPAASEPTLSLEATATMKQIRLFDVSVNRAREHLLPLLDSPLFPSMLVYEILVIATCDAAHAVFSDAESRLKRSSVDLNNELLMRKLFMLYRGNTRTPPAPPALKVRLLGVFCRSRTACNLVPDCVLVANDALFGPASSRKLVQQGTEFAQWLTSQMDKAQLAVEAEAIFDAVSRLALADAELDDDDDDHSDGHGAPSSGADSGSAAHGAGGGDAAGAASPSGAAAPDAATRASAFVCFGSLVARVPGLLYRHFDRVRALLALQAGMQGVLKVAVNECLSHVAGALRRPPPGVREPLLAELMRAFDGSGDAPVTVELAVRWARDVFAFADVEARIICLLALGDTAAGCRDEAQRGLEPYSLPGDEIGHAPDFPPLTETCKLVSALLEAGAPPRLAERALAAGEALVQFVWSVLEHAAARAQLAPRAFLASAAVSATRAVAQLHAVCVRLLTHTSTSLEAKSEAASLLLDVLHVLVAQGQPVDDALVRALVSNILHGAKTQLRDHCALLYRVASATLSESSVVEHWRTALKQFEAGDRAGPTRMFGAIASSRLFRAVDFDQCLAVFYNGLLADSVEWVLSCCAAVQQICSSGHAQLLVPSLPFFEESLSELCKHTQDKVRDEAVLTLALLAAAMAGSEAASALHASTLQLLLGSYEDKRESFQMAVGAGLAACTGQRFCEAFGEWDSAAGAAPFDEQRAVAAIRGVLVAMYSGKPIERRSATIWMGCVLERAGSAPPLLANLADVQAAFSLLLTDTDEITQEMASKGISLVYDLSSPDERQRLVAQLIGSLQGDDKRRLRTEASSAILPPDVLGRVPESLGGGDLTSYKEFCSLADELHKPELVYKFLDLARNYSVWSARRGAAVGMSEILARSREYLLPFLPALVPKLFRYQFDPNARVQAAMGAVWRSLAAEPRHLVDEHFDAIVAELVGGMSQSAWRTREASCLGLADVLPGRSIAQLSQRLLEVWTLGFRALDDIKESVRKAGFVVCRVLAKESLRLCDVARTSEASARQSVQIVLPFLLDQGLVSDVAEVRKFVLGTLHSLVKVAAKVVGPHVPAIVGSLLESMSSMEEQMFSYLQLHAQARGMSEHVEVARASAAKASVLAQIIDDSLALVTSDNIKEVVSRLVALVKSGVGLPTRAGTADFIGKLAVHRRFVLRGNTKRLMRVMTSALKDPSATVRKVFADSLARLVACARPEHISALVDTLRAFYVESLESAGLRAAAALCVRQMFRHSLDAITSYASVVAPIAFVGCFDADTETCHYMKDAWELISPSSLSGCRLYFDEISSLCVDSLRSESWPRRRQGALALKEACINAPDRAEQALELLAGVLLDALPGRLWDGKEAVLAALAALCRVAKRAVAADAALTERLLAAIVRECGRSKRAYIVQALQCLAGAVEALQPPALLERVLALADAGSGGAGAGGDGGGDGTGDGAGDAAASAESARTGAPLSSDARREAEEGARVAQELTIERLHCVQEAYGAASEAEQARLQGATLRLASASVARSRGWQVQVAASVLLVHVVRKSSNAALALAALQDAEVCALVAENARSKYTALRLAAADTCLAALASLAEAGAAAAPSDRSTALELCASVGAALRGDTEPQVRTRLQQLASELAAEQRKE